MNHKTMQYRRAAERKHRGHMKTLSNLYGGGCGPRALEMNRDGNTWHCKDSSRTRDHLVYRCLDNKIVRHSNPEILWQRGMHKKVWLKRYGR